MEECIKPHDSIIRLQKWIRLVLFHFCSPTSFGLLWIKAWMVFIQSVCVWFVLGKDCLVGQLEYAEGCPFLWPGWGVGTGWLQLSHLPLPLLPPLFSSEQIPVALQGCLLAFFWLWGWASHLVKCGCCCPWVRLLLVLSTGMIRKNHFREPSVLRFESSSFPHPFFTGHFLVRLDLFLVQSLVQLKEMQIKTTL